METLIKMKQEAGCERIKKLLDSLIDKKKQSVNNILNK